MEYASNTLDSTAGDEEELFQNTIVRVSSKHLTLASRVFKRMLQARFKEGLELHSKGSAELPLPDDDPAALLILLNLIHGKTRKVPRKVKLSRMTELAILVDKYELFDSVELWVDHWVRHLQGTVPVALGGDLLLWMCISWVFKRADIFKRLTKIAQLEREGLLEADQLPIPQSVLGTRLATMFLWKF